MFTEHKSFVQGVAYDPLGVYLATISCDRCGFCWFYPLSFLANTLNDTMPCINFCRSCRIYSFANRSCLHNITKMAMPASTSNRPTSPSSNNNNTKSKRIFHDDTMKSFFRRLDFSPDGNLLVVPSGCLETGSSSSSSSSSSSNSDQNVYTTLVFSRHSLSKWV